MSPETSDDQDWLRLAEEAFGDGQPDSEPLQEDVPALMHWRYRAPVS